MLVDQLADERDHSLHELGFAMRAVGKERIVGDVDDARVRPRRLDLAKNREASQAGVEHENCWTLGHGT